MVDHDDEAMARLRASDPATGSDPDLHSLRHAIGTKAPASRGDAEHVTHLHDDALAGPRPRVPWIAAAAVAALGIGAGGYALGSQTNDPAPVARGGGDEARPASPGTVEHLGSASASAAADGSMSGEGYASSSSSMGGGSGADYDPGPVRLVAGPGLSTSTGTAEVQALVSDTDPDEFLTAWQERLSFEGKPLAGDGSEPGWFGGHAILNAETLQVLIASRDDGGPMHFSYEDMLGNPYCAEMYEGVSAEELATMKSEWSKAVGADVPFPDASLCKEVSGPAPAKDAAVATAREFLATTGLDFSGYEITAMDYDEPGSSTVSLEGYAPGSLSQQLNLSLTVGPDGVISAFGTTGEMTSLGEYPVISAVDAVARYGQREFSLDYGVQLAEDINREYTDEAWATAMPEPTFSEPSQIEPGMRIPLLLKEKTVTSAELVQGSIYTQTGSLEVPAWKLITADGMHYVVLAVAEEAIDWQSWE